MAGHDTTASALSFAIYYLAAHPVKGFHFSRCPHNFKLIITYCLQQQDIQEKARQEAIRVFGDDPVDILPTVEQTKELEYINMVIKEASILDTIQNKRKLLLTGTVRLCVSTGQLRL